MAFEVHTAETADQSTWEIKKDAFAPSTTRRLIRGWDRAPVSAHAPRFHGQKVWKKVGLRSVTVEDSHDEAQEELKKEGGGARKKSRIMGAKENIGDAIWVDVFPAVCAGDALRAPEINGAQTENHCVRTMSAKDSPPHPTQSGAISPDLHFVPRKRTNMNHVITPRKHLQQTTLNQQAQPQPLTKHTKSPAAKAIRPRKSLRKSILRITSEDVVGQEDLKSQALPSYDIEHSKDIESIVLNGRAAEIQTVEATTTRRNLRRSTAAARRSAADVEQSAGSHYAGPECSEAASAEGCTVPVVISSDLITCLGSSATALSDDLSTICPPNLADSNSNIVTDVKELGECEEIQGYSLNIIPSTIDTKALHIVAGTHPDISADNQDTHGQIQEEILDEDATEPVPMFHGQDVEVFEELQSPSKIQQLVASSTSEAQFKQDYDTNNVGAAAAVVEGSSVAVNVVSFPVRPTSSGSLEPRNEVPHLEIGETSEASTELLVPRDDVENMERAQMHDPPTSNLTEAISINVTASTYDHDDTDILRNFLSRVKANKAAKKSPRRKRSLPHSPLRIPLGDLDNNLSPSPLRPVGELGLIEPSPSKRKKRGTPVAQGDDGSEVRSCRRSSRTRLPLKEPPGVPSFIPVRRFGQDNDTTVTLKRNEDKELAALTRVNTRKNKGTALSASEVLAKKLEEKEDPVLRQRLLKEVFDEKAGKEKKGKDRNGKEKKRVTWAEELAQFQNLTKSEMEQNKDEKEKDKAVFVQGAEEKKQGAVRVGVRSKTALGMALNGTPAPKRKMRGRA